MLHKMANFSLISHKKTNFFPHSLVVVFVKKRGGGGGPKRQSGERRPLIFM